MERQKRAEARREAPGPQPRDDRDGAERQRRREGRPPPDGEGALQGAAGQPGDRWGQLPRKLHQDAQNAQNQPPPSRYRGLIERYRERLAEEE